MRHETYQPLMGAISPGMYVTIVVEGCDERNPVSEAANLPISCGELAWAKAIFSWSIWPLYLLQLRFRLSAQGINRDPKRKRG